MSFCVRTTTEQKCIYVGCYCDRRMCCATQETSDYHWGSRCPWLGESSFTVLLQALVRAPWRLSSDGGGARAKMTNSLGAPQWFCAHRAQRSVRRRWCRCTRSWCARLLLKDVWLNAPHLKLGSLWRRLVLFLRRPHPSCNAIVVAHFL
jgi:hypothetical protein